MSSSQPLTSTKQTRRPFLVHHERNHSIATVDTPNEADKRPGALWSDKMAFRIWLACGLLLWLLGFINLVTGVARK
jgi:hypothetical protein